MPPWAADLLALAACVAAFLLALAWLGAGRLSRRWKPDPPSAPEDFGLPCQPVEFASRDGVPLVGRLIGPGGGRPVVVFAAGLFGSMDGDTELALPLVRAGYDVFQFDWRGHGASGGERVTLGVRERDDLVGAVDVLQARGAKWIALLGFSMGGAVALRVAAADRRVACVICDGGYVHLAHALEGFARSRLGLPLKPFVWLVMRLAEVRLGLRLAEADPLPHVGTISPNPTLLIYGSADPFVPPADQDALFGACREPKSIWRIEGAGHRDGFERHPEAYLERVIGFLNESRIGFRERRE
ncbi:MAG: alpha/beta fold hydrolase [Chloroflexota bacterium]